MLILRLMFAQKNTLIYQNLAAVDLFVRAQERQQRGVFFLIGLLTTNTSCLGHRKHWRCVHVCAFMSVSPGQSKSPHHLFILDVSLIQSTSLTHKGGGREIARGGEKSSRRRQAWTGQEGDLWPSMSPRTGRGGSQLTVTSCTKTAGWAEGGELNTWDQICWSQGSSLHSFSF